MSQRKIQHLRLNIQKCNEESLSISDAPSATDITLQSTKLQLSCRILKITLQKTTCVVRHKTALYPEIA
jgi:hypothetical protein